jgi:hypothetical protein
VVIPPISSSPHVAVCGVYIAQEISPESFSHVAPGISPEEVSLAFILHGIAGLSHGGYSDKEILAACQDAVTFWKDR